MPHQTVALKERLQYLGLAILTVFNTYVCASLVAAALAPLSDHRLLLNTVPLLCATLIVTALTVALLPRGSWPRIGLGRGVSRGVTVGLVLGFIACGELLLVVVLFGLAEWVPIADGALRFDFRAAPGLGLSLLVIGATAEELFARGLALQCLARALGPVGAVILTSVGFAALHGANPGVTFLAACNTALFGAVFGVAVFRQRSLWLATGLHIGWNVAQVALGVNVSGITMRLTEFNLRLGQPDWITGGDYGFEGGLLATRTALGLLAAAWWIPAPTRAAPTLWDAPREDAGTLASGLAGIDRTSGDEPGDPIGERED